MHLVPCRWVSLCKAGRLTGDSCERQHSQLEQRIVHGLPTHLRARRDPPRCARCGAARLPGARSRGPAAAAAASGRLRALPPAPRARQPRCPARLSGSATAARSPPPRAQLQHSHKTHCTYCNASNRTTTYWGKGKPLLYFCSQNFSSKLLMEVVLFTPAFSLAAGGHPCKKLAGVLKARKSTAGKAHGADGSLELRHDALKRRAAKQGQLRVWWVRHSLHAWPLRSASTLQTWMLRLQSMEGPQVPIADLGTVAQDVPEGWSSFRPVAALRCTAVAAGW